MTTAWHMTLNQKACGCKRRYMKSVLGTTVSAFRRIIGTRCHFVLNGQKEGTIRVGGWWQAVEVCGQVSWDPVGGFINTFSGLASFDSVHIFWQFLGILLVWFASRSLERSKSQELGALRCSALSASIYYSVNAFHPRFKKHLQR